MANAKSIGTKRMSAKFNKDFKSEPEVRYQDRTYNEKTKDIEIKDIVSIVGGVVKTLSSMENRNRDAVADKKDPDTIQQSKVTRENTKVMERLTARITSLGIATKESTNAIIDRTKGSFRSIKSGGSAVKNDYKKLVEYLKTSEDKGIKSIRGVLKATTYATKKSISVLTTVTRGGFKMIDWTLTKFLGPMFIDMTKTLAKFSMFYFVIEGIRQSIWHLLKKYDEGREAFVNAFGEDYTHFSDFAKSIKDFNEAYKKDGLVSAIAQKATPIISSLASVVGGAIVDGFDHVIVAINNWWHNNNPDKQMTVEEYRNKSAVDDIRSGKGAPVGKEDRYSVLTEKMNIMDGFKDSMVDSVLQYGQRLFDARGNVNPSELDMFIKRGMDWKDKDFAKTKAKESGMKLEEYLTNLFESDEWRNKRSEFEGMLGTDGIKSDEFKAIRDSLQLLRESDTAFTSWGREGKQRSHDADAYFDQNSDIYKILDKKILTSEQSQRNIEFTKQRLKLEQVNRGGSFTGIDIESGYLEKLYNDSINSDDERVREEAEIFRRKVENQFGVGALNTGNQYDGKTMYDTQEMENAQSILLKQKEAHEENTRAIKLLSESISGIVGGIGGGVMMQNIKNNTTVVNPKTELKVITRGIDVS